MVRNIEPDDPMLQYSGRIDDDDPKAPVLIYAASWVKMIFTGTSVAVTLANHHAYWTNAVSYTPLTLPTSSSVEISVVALTIKKKK